MQGHFKVRSLVVKTMTVDGKDVHRHFFEWFDRGSLAQCYLRLTLIRQDGTTIGKTHDLKFSKVKLLGTVDVVQDGVTTQKPHYDQSAYFYVDADEIAVGYDFYTATVTKRYDPVVAVISLKREDLRLAQEKADEILSKNQ